MSVNRILKKRKQQAMNHEASQMTEQQRSNVPQLGQEQPRLSKQEQHLEQQFQKYTDYVASNPPTYQFSNSVLPCNASLQKRFNIPLSVFMPPVSYEMEPVQKSIDKIPRCASCRAYMNYYNQVKQKTYVCFLCGRENMLEIDYQVSEENVELTYPSYHVLGGDNIYTQIPPENTIAFLIDLNSSSFQSRMLSYFSSVVKDVLSRQEFNQTQIFFFTYDQVVHQYDFSGQEVKCTILDSSIKDSQKGVNENFLQNIRDKLFNLIDSLQESAQKNTKQGSNFFQAFNYVYEQIKDTGAKIFVFQCNQNISGQAFANQYVKNPNNQIEARPKSFLESKNKQFFNSHVHNFINNSLSCSFFIFQKNFKNVRVFGDFSKLTNCEVLTYRKDVNEDLMKFYYDFYYLLSAPYYRDVRLQIILCAGWYPTAVYGNLNRAKQHITFKFCHLEPSKRICLTFLPQQNLQLPYFAMQVVTNYQFNRQHFVTVNTSVLPLTTSLEKLYQFQNYSIAASTLHRTFFSNLRLEEVNFCRNKMVKYVATIWKSAQQHFKKRQSPQIDNLMLSQLAILKSSHSQLDSINDTIALDTVIWQRNLLQNCGTNELQNFFSPYLFNLSNMTQQMCSDDQNFVYPEVCELKFGSVKDGLFLMDNGLSLFLYIAKTQNPGLLRMLFGKQKFTKHDVLSEESILTNNHFGQQVTNLIRVCRQQKSYGWVPLYIVRCGEGSLNEKLFYLNFYAQKYDQYRNYKFSLPEFTALLNQQY